MARTTTTTATAVADGGDSDGGGDGDDADAAADGELSLKAAVVCTPRAPSSYSQCFVINKCHYI
jgi:hypothetical protein